MAEAVSCNYRIGWDAKVEDLPPNHLNNIGMMLSSDTATPRVLAGHLAISCSELTLHGIQGTGPNPGKDVLELWSRKCHEGATIRMLEVALQAMKRNDVIQYMKEKAMLDPYTQLVVLRDPYKEPFMEILCPVIGNQTLRSVLEPRLEKICHQLEDVDIYRPRMLRDGSSVTWDTPAYKLKSSQLDLILQQNVKNDMALRHSSVEDNDGYSRIDDDDWAPGPKLVPRATSLDSNLTASLNGGVNTGFNNLNRDSCSSWQSQKSPIVGYKGVCERGTERKSACTSSYMGENRQRENRYGPPPRRSPTQVKHELVNRDLSPDVGDYLTMAIPCTGPEGCIGYWPNMGTSKKEIKGPFKLVLKKGEDGHYLLRPIKDSGESNVNFALSITCRKRLKHFLIHEDVQPRESKFYLFKDGYRAGSISGLIDHYQIMPLCPPSSAVIDGAYGDTRTLKLKYPISPPLKLEVLSENVLE